MLTSNSKLVALGLPSSSFTWFSSSPSSSSSSSYSSSLSSTYSIIFLCKIDWAFGMSLASFFLSLYDRTDAVTETLIVSSTEPLTVWFDLTVSDLPCSKLVLSSIGAFAISPSIRSENWIKDTLWYRRIWNYVVTSCYTFLSFNT